MNLDDKALLRSLVELSYKQGNTHMMSALTALPIITKIYREHPGTMFILSKGHAWLAHAVVLQAMGYKPNVVQTHPNRDAANGVICTTGSLGHGLPIALGIALAMPEQRVDVLLGDAECMEGTFWECLNICHAFRVRNLHIHIDWNGHGATGRTMCSPHALLCNHIQFLTFHLAIRGAGVALYERNPEWHVHKLTAEEYESILKELP